MARNRQDAKSDTQREAIGRPPAVRLGRALKGATMAKPSSTEFEYGHGHEDEDEHVGRVRARARVR
jgi:hypothetical protein